MHFAFPVLRHRGRAAFIACTAVLALFTAGAPAEDATLQTLRAAWEKPARTYKPHTRWWWPGNALTKAEITWQLEQMATQGLGGVEIMSMWKVYQRGNVEYLSPEFLEQIEHAVAEAKRLDMEVAITFSPGWSFGGAWVPPEDRSQGLRIGSTELDSGAVFRGPPPLPELRHRRESATGSASASTGRTLVAVVAGRIVAKDRLDGDSLTVLTPTSARVPRASPVPSADLRMPGGASTGRASGTPAPSLEWSVPPGRWRLMAFWLEPTGQECSAQSFQPPPMVIDHLNRGAVERYCRRLGGVFQRAIGDGFGRTVDSFFCDSFEIHPPDGGLLWSTDTLAGFEKFAGYDFTRYLPAIWVDIGPLTPRVRYDLGAYLSHVGVENFYKPFNAWCDAHGVAARIQPHYRFPTELVEGAGNSARPETEVTTCRFEPVADPRKATASGARFYGRAIVSAEAYTFIHPARYRTDLQDLKIATDAFLRDGVTQFYNHGYFASPERHVAPTRDFPWANRIGHWNTWWKYYHHVAAYVARCCAVLRHGRLVADVLIYSPQATAWSRRALWGSTRRVMPYGNLPKTLVANGYDFDVVNDDLLQHKAVFRDGRIAIAGHEYRVLILPAATVVPIETMRAIERYAAAGGTIVALGALPESAAGMKDHEARDRELRAIVARLFGAVSGTLRVPSGPIAAARRAPTADGTRSVPGTLADGARSVPGTFIPEYAIDAKPFNPGRQPWRPTPPPDAGQRRLLEVLRRVTPPDFVLGEGAQSDGLTFIHKRCGEVDVYFVCNLQPNRLETEVTFRVTGKLPQRWDAIAGGIETVRDYRAAAGGTTVPLAFEPWESAIFVFAPPSSGNIAKPQADKDEAEKGVRNHLPERPSGCYAQMVPDTFFHAHDGGRIANATRSSFPVNGAWRMTLEGFAFETYRAEVRTLASWTDSPRTRHFSGTGRYEIEFDLPAGHVPRFLDLGRVGTVAEVELNGQPVGVAWMAPYRLDISKAARPGRNRLVVLVTNTMINYVSGLKAPPEVPPELQPRLGKADEAIYPFSGWARNEMSETDLPPSGLLGPVRVLGNAE